MHYSRIIHSLVGKATLVAAIAGGGTFAVPAVLGAGATAAQASEVCVWVLPTDGSGQVPGVAGVSTSSCDTNSSALTAAAAVNVDVANPGSPSAPPGCISVAGVVCAGASGAEVSAGGAGVDAWFSGVSASPQGQLVVFANGTCTGITSDTEDC